MPRTTPKDVEEILGQNYDTINCPSLYPYIKAANVVISRVIDCAEEQDITITDTEAREMERWLAAYYYTVNDPIYKSKQTGNSSATYFDRSYLDVATSMDPTSCLKTQISGTNAGFTWLGKVPTDQIDVDDRTTD